MNSNQIILKVLRYLVAIWFFVFLGSMGAHGSPGKDLTGGSKFALPEIPTAPPRAESVILPKPTNDINYYQTVFQTDFVAAGVGGLRDVGYGEISLSGITGTVTQALLYWTCPTNSSDPGAGAAVYVNSQAVVGTNIGFSSDNCWLYDNSQAYIADITALVKSVRNGSYSLTGFGAGSPVNSNGASLIVFFNDGITTNNRDIVIFHGNDSNTDNAYDAPGWNVILSGINYSAGAVNLQLHVADGQTWPDDDLILNGAILVPLGPIFDGNSVPSANNGPNGDGSLWDIKTWEISSYFDPGVNTLTLTTQLYTDCLGLVVAIVDLPAGAAPDQAPVAKCRDIIVSADGNCQSYLNPEHIDDGSYDPDGGPITMYLAPPGPYQLGTTQVLLIVEDDEGDSDTCLTSITVEDNTGPQVTCPGNIFVDVDTSAGGAIVEFNFTASDNCPGLVAEADPPSGSFFPLGTTMVTVRATDAVGYWKECYFNVYVGPNQSPVLNPIGSKSVDEGQILSFVISATDPDGTIPTLTAEDVPTNATFTDHGNGTGTFAFNPDYTQAGTYYVRFVASDGLLHDVEEVKITVNDINQPPALALIGSKSVNESETLSFGVSATDPDGTIPALTAENIPANATFTDNGNGTGTFYFTPDNTQAGTYHVRFIASDGSLADEQVVEITVIEKNRAPILVSIGSRSVSEGQNLNFGVSASDPDGDPLSLVAEYLPTNATFTDHGNGTGTFDFNADYGQAGTYNVHFIASDGSLSDDEWVTVTVTEKSRPPVLDPIGSKTVDEGGNLSFSVSASDPDGDPLTLSANNLPTNATFTDFGDGTGTFDFNPDYTQAGIYNVTFVASDGSLDDSKVVTITVNDTNRRPELDLTTTHMVDEGQNLHFDVWGGDPDGDLVTLSAMDVPANATFSDHGDGFGTFEFSPDYAQAGIYYVTIIVSDGSLADSEVVSITVNDVNRAPVWDPIGSYSVYEGQNLNFSMSATDPDGDPVSLTAEDVPANATFTDLGDGTGTFDFNPDFDQAGFYYVIFISSDGTGADSEAVTIEVINVNRPPEVSVPADTQEVEVDSVIVLLITADDPDGDPLALSVAMPAGPDQNWTFVDSSNGNGSFTFRPDASQEGDYQILFTASDGEDVDTDTLFLRVIPKPLRFTINVTHAESIMIDDEAQVNFNVPIDPSTVNSTTLNVSVDSEIIDCEYRFIDENRSIIFNPQGFYPPLSVVVVDLSGLEGAGGETWPPGEPSPATFYTRFGVHPGDLNNDGAVDHLDILQIAAHWRQTGHARFGSGLNWRSWGMKPAMGWTEPEVTYADADGDGTVDQNDLFPIGHHWQNTHEYPIPVTGSGSSFAPEYYQEELQALYDAVRHNQSPFMQTVKVYLEGLLKVDAVPQRFWLSQNFPNPFNASTSITFYLPDSDHAKLAVINALGRHVRLLERRDFPAGKYTYVWDGRDDNGDCVASGLYFFQLTGQSFTGTLKMTLLK